MRALINAPVGPLNRKAAPTPNGSVSTTLPVLSTTISPPDPLPKVKFGKHAVGGADDQFARMRVDRQCGRRGGRGAGRVGEDGAVFIAVLGRGSVERQRGGGGTGDIAERIAGVGTHLPLDGRGREAAAAATNVTGLPALATWLVGLLVTSTRCKPRP